MRWIAGSFLLLIFLFLLALRKKRDVPGMVRHYARKEALFSAAERSFFGVIEQAVGADFRLFGKVRMADVLDTAPGLNRSEEQTARNKIDRKHFDYVLCRADDLSVLCAIELNDKSHKGKSRQSRDAFLDAACRQAGLPLIMFEAKAAYVVADVRERIFAATNGHAAVLQGEAIEPSLAPNCPRCASPMVRRMAQGGNNAGKAFWGCKNFPACREIRMC